MTGADVPSERVVGRVVKAHGLRGELVVESRTDNAEERFAPGVVLAVRSGSRTLALDAVTIVAARRHADRLLVTVEEVADRDGADALRTALLVAAGSDSALDDPDEFHDHELEGLTVVLADGPDGPDGPGGPGGTVVGVVTEVLHGAGGELLSLATDAGREILVPFVAAIVVSVDVAGGRVVLDPPEGLLDE